MKIFQTKSIHSEKSKYRLLNQIMDDLQL